MRPLLAYEQAKNATDVVELIGGSIVKVPQKVYLGGAGSPPAEAEKLQFDYDRVYRGSNITRQLFIELTEPLLRQYLNGFNATVSTVHVQTACQVTDRNTMAAIDTAGCRYLPMARLALERRTPWAQLLLPSRCAACRKKV